LFDHNSKTLSADRRLLCTQKYSKKAENMKKNLFITTLLGLFLLAQTLFAQQLLTEEILWDMAMVGAPAVAPHGKSAVYSVRYTSLNDNKGQNDLFIIDLMKRSITRLTNTPASESQYSWTPDGSRIGYLSGASGSSQLWEMNADGSNNRQVSNIEGGIEGYGYAPDGNRIFYIKRIKLDTTLADRFPQLSKATGRLFDGLMYRHWDSFHDGTYSHVFIQDYHKGELNGSAIDLLNGEKFHSPLQPFGGSDEITWSPDGKQLVYTSKKLHGTASATSTNADLYLYDLQSGETTNLTQGLMGYDVHPTFSPDGTKLAWLSMERDGYEADKNRVMVRDMKTGAIAEVTKNFDYSANSLFWGRDANRLFFGVYRAGTTQLYEHFFDLARAAKTYGIKTRLKGSATMIVTEGQFNHSGYAYVNSGTNGQMLMLRQSMQRPNEIFSLNLATKQYQALTDVNGELYKKLKPVSIESRQIATTDGKSMQSWVIYPPDFDPNKKYPTLLYCQGGPQSMIGQAFSMRWNFYLMASKGYIVVAPNRRGLPGFGQEWNEQISGDWGGQAMQDYLSAIDDVAKEPFVDRNRLGAVGASFGGYSVYWLAGNHEKRFKAFISHCGVYNLESMYGQTEEIFFTDFEMKGTPWQTPQPESYERFSPHKYVKNWDTPLLVIHNEKDFRVPLAQGMEAFTAAQLQGVPSKFLYFPDENHWVLKPQNSVLWQKVFFEWLENYLQ
jgi:dipeptidyl aminopeptidase/acylaminoacyl peptidase